MHDMTSELEELSVSSESSKDDHSHPEVWSSYPRMKRKKHYLRQN